MTDFKGPTLEQLDYLKTRFRSLPDELNVAREAAGRLAAEVKERRIMLAECEAEVGALARAELLAVPPNALRKAPTEVALTLAAKAAIEKSDAARALRERLRETELRHDGAEFTVKHLTDRFLALQHYAALTVAEVRLITFGVDL